MCGIIGYLGNDSFINYILSGLQLIQNRGYDSVGIATINNNELNIIKYASTNTFNSLETVIQRINSIDCSGNIGIGHTRWATHGGKTDINAHPHTDMNDRIALVHNGIIENYLDLKNDLISKGYTFRSSTDTEVISVQIGYWLDQGLDTTDAISRTVEMLNGTWALVIIDKNDPLKLWITRNGSPLLLGLDDSFVMIASEQIAFGPYINRYIVINNHDLIEIDFDIESHIISFSKDIHSYNIKTNIQQDFQLTPEPFNYWMEKEIREQTQSVNRSLNYGGRIESDTKVKLGGLDGKKSELIELENIIILGCGTSLNAGKWAEHLFKSFDIFNTVSVYDGAEFTFLDIPKKGKTGLILLSQSGETKDLHRCLTIAQTNNLITIGIVNVVDSMIARETTCGVYLNAGREVAVASTKSFTSQCVVLSLIVIWFSQQKGSCIEKRKRLITDLRNLSWGINKIIDNWNKIHLLVQELNMSKSCFILGKGHDEAIAKESALKLKEIAYIHAEGFSSSALKHGPFALINQDVPIFILNTNQEFTEKNMNAYYEVKARDAKVILIGSDINSDLKVEYSHTFSGVLANIYLQIFAFELGIKTGSNPDYPKNLAKVVTVE
jgi:glucosamine--fructose-6-phosphate aminotransferase (isomerizing)